MPTTYQLHATPAGEPRRTAARHTRPRGWQRASAR